MHVRTDPESKIKQVRNKEIESSFNASGCEIKQKLQQCRFDFIAFALSTFP